MGIFDELPDLIADVLTDLNDSEGLGFTATYTSVTPGVYDPATGTATPTTSTQDVLAFEDSFSMKELMAGLVQTNDKAIGIAAALLTATPKPTDTVTIGGVTLTVIRLRDTTPGAETVLHQLHLRGS